MNQLNLAHNLTWYMIVDFIWFLIRYVTIYDTYHLKFVRNLPIMNSRFDIMLNHALHH